MRALIQLCSLFLVVSIFLSAQTPPAENQAGDFLFQIPPGWQRTDRLPKTFLAPIAAANSSTYIQIAGYDLGNNDLQAGFTAELAGLEKAYRVLTRGQTTFEHSPNGFDYYAATLAVADSSGKQWAMAVFGAQYGHRLETVVFMTSEPQPQIRNAYIQDLQNFLGTVHFGPAQSVAQGPKTSTQRSAAQRPADGATAPASNASARSIERNMSTPPSGPMSFNQLPTVPGKFNGIFRATPTQEVDPSTLDIADPSRNTPNYQYLVLFSDGSAMRGLPDMGLNAYKASVRLDISGGGNAAARWGVYSMAGNQGRVVFASPTAAGQQLVSGRLVGDAWTIQEFPDHLVVNGNSFIFMDGGTAGQKLEGTYKPFGDRKKPGISFTRDGQFDDEGILKTGGATGIGIAGGGLAIGYAFNSPGPGRGMYHIGNYTLNLNYANGQSPPVLFWIDPATPNAQVIYLGNVKFQLVK